MTDPATITPAPAPPATDEVARTCNLLALAAIPTRLRALRALMEGDRDAGQLAALCGLDETTSVAGSLDLLRHGGLIEVGTIVTGDPIAATARRVYRITPEGRSLVRAAALATARVA